MLSANDTLLLLYMAGIKKAFVTPCVVGLERVMGIEPTSKAWEAFVLPLNYTRKIRGAALGVTLPSQYLNIAVTRPLQRLASF